MSPLYVPGRLRVCWGRPCWCHVPWYVWLPNLRWQCCPTPMLRPLMCTLKPFQTTKHCSSAVFPWLHQISLCTRGSRVPTLCLLAVSTSPCCIPTSCHVLVYLRCALARATFSFLCCKAKARHPTEGNRSVTCHLTSPSWHTHQLSSPTLPPCPALSCSTVTGPTAPTLRGHSTDVNCRLTQAPATLSSPAHPHQTQSPTLPPCPSTPCSTTNWARRPHPVRRLACRPSWP